MEAAPLPFTYLAHQAPTATVAGAAVGALHHSTAFQVAGREPVAA